MLQDKISRKILVVQQNRCDKTKMNFVTFKYLISADWEKDRLANFKSLLNLMILNNNIATGPRTLNRLVRKEKKC